ncbi:MAG: hypothetical protein OEU26_35685, partial [Candidatus Tectomicrobia bacterium]|nr:hypothetical protein [Candidatus Tectomicrobia bacterium]
MRNRQPKPSIIRQTGLWLGIMALSAAYLCTLVSAQQTFPAVQKDDESFVIKSDITAATDVCGTWEQEELQQPPVIKASKGLLKTTLVVRMKDHCVPVSDG